MSKAKLSKKDEQTLLENMERRKRRNEIRTNSNQPSINENLKANYTDRTVMQITYDQLYEAPRKWNNFKKHPETKRLEMMESIRNNGLIEPVVLWKIPKCEMEKYYNNHENWYSFNGENYMILSGHNRAEVCKYLYEIGACQDYKTIPAFVYDATDLYHNNKTFFDLKARSIIIDTNYLTRELTLQEKVESIMFKYDVYSNDKTKVGEKGKNIADTIAKELSISKRAVFNYRDLGLMPKAFRDMVYEGKIGLKQALKIASYEDDIQQYLLQHYKELLANDTINKFKAKMTKKAIDNLFNKLTAVQSNEYKYVRIKVPISHEKEILTAIEKLILNILKTKTENSES